MTRRNLAAKICLCNLRDPHFHINIWLTGGYILAISLFINLFQPVEHNGSNPFYNLDNRDTYQTQPNIIISTYLNKVGISTNCDLNLQQKVEKWNWTYAFLYGKSVNYSITERNSIKRSNWVCFNLFMQG